MMNRRGFLGAIAAAVAGATLDPERALWVPGARLISVPAPRGLIAAHDPARWVMTTLEDHFQVQRALRGDYGELFCTPNVLKVGDTIAIRKPRAFLGRA